MITKEIQQQMFDEYGTPEHVRRHCDAVTQAAVRIGKALNEAGYDLDMDLIEGASRIHDVCRTADRHDEVGAEFLIERGYPEEAELVRHHMRHPFNDVSDINEQDVLCLADRVVKEDEYVGIEERMKYLLAKPQVTPEWAVRIIEAMEQTKVYIKEIERVIGTTFDELLK